MSDKPEIPDSLPNSDTPSGRRLALFMEIVEEHKGKVEVRMSAVEETKLEESWNHENPMKPHITEVKTGKTHMHPTLVMTRVPMGERESLKAWLQFLVKTKLNEDIEIEHEVDPRAVSKDRKF